MIRKDGEGRHESFRNERENDEKKERIRLKISMKIIGKEVKRKEGNDKI